MRVGNGATLTSPKPAPWQDGSLSMAKDGSDGLRVRKI